MNRGDGCPTITDIGSTTSLIITGPGCQGDSTTGIRLGLTSTLEVVMSDGLLGDTTTGVVAMW